jgi:hypothetical protein
MEMKANIQPIAEEDLINLFSSKQFRKKIYEGLEVLRKGYGESGFNIARSIYDNSILIGDLIISKEYDTLSTSESLDSILKKEGLDDIYGEAYRIFDFHYHPSGNIGFSRADLNGLHSALTCYHQIASKPIRSVGINYQEKGKDIIDILLLQWKSNEQFTFEQIPEIADVIETIETDTPYTKLIESIESSNPGKLNCEVIRYFAKKGHVVFRKGDETKLKKFSYTPKYLGIDTSDDDELG